MKEKALQDKIISYLKEKNIYYVKVHGGGWTGKGAPDLILCLNGFFVGLELKVGKNQMSPAQRLHKKRILNSNGIHAEVRTLDQVMELVEIYTKKTGKS